MDDKIQKLNIDFLELAKFMALEVAVHKKIYRKDPKDERIEMYASALAGYFYDIFKNEYWSNVWIKAEEAEDANPNNGKAFEIIKKEFGVEEKELPEANE